MSPNPSQQDIREHWWTTHVVGSMLRLECGIAGTRKAPTGHHLSEFPFETTVVLGDSGKNNPRNPSTRTIAHWEIPTTDFPIRLYTRGYLLIACFRHFGGLHSPTLKDRAEILLNDNVLDGFELQFVPEGHRDFFHEIPYPDAPRISPFSDCTTVYSWFVPTSHLRSEPVQRLTIRLDRDAKWDIDYIGFLFERPRRCQQVFISHSSRDKEIARRLAANLESRGIGVWIDEAEIKLGDSLLDKIRAGIDSVDYVLVLLSKNSIDSSWVNKEIQIAMTQEIEGKRVKVFAVLIDDVQLPSYLLDKQYADLRDLSQYDSVVLQIVSRVMP